MQKIMYKCPDKDCNKRTVKYGIKGMKIRCTDCGDWMEPVAPKEVNDCIETTQKRGIKSYKRRQ